MLAVSVAVLLLLLLLLLGGADAAPRTRARSSSSRDDVTTRGDDLVTDTESGRVRGIRYHAPYLRRPVDAYLGIPFAKPPLNALRFRHPQPIEKWRHIYNATRQPNSCYQLHDTVFGTDFYVSIARIDTAYCCTSTSYSPWSLYRCVCVCVFDTQKHCAKRMNRSQAGFVGRLS